MQAKLWLQRNGSKSAAVQGESQRRRTLDGNLVGEKAREALGKNVIWPRGDADHEVAARKARDLIKHSPDSAVVEMPMLADGVYSRADALVPYRDGYILRETKASSFPLKADKKTPKKPQEHHLEDVAIQAWVMERNGLPLRRSELSFLNSQWRYPGGGDYRGLFRQMNVTAELKLKTAEVSQWLTEATQVLAGEMPTIATGDQCREPYECPFLEHCRKLDLPGVVDPIELLPDQAGKRLAKKLRETKGYTSIRDPRPKELTGKNAALYRRIQEAHCTGRPVWKAGAEKIIKKWPYPRYYFDFEGIDLPVPRWRGVRPYEQIPFQWSCHIERSHAVFEHAEFLDLSGNDPSLPCIQRLLNVIDLDDNGPIIVYSATYEKSRLLELAKRHPAHLTSMHRYVARIVDLLPIVREHYYHPQMRGHFSIKDVLPIIAPDLDYSKLRGVQDGGGAQIAYLDAIGPATGEPRKAEIDHQLRAYCRQDTWAMVEVAYFLAGHQRPDRLAA